MNIFDATLKLKDHLYKGNQQLIEINGNVEVSGFSLLPLLTYFGKMKNIKDYEKYTRVFKKEKTFLFDDFKHVRRDLNPHNKKTKWAKNMFYSDELTPTNVNTKDYWNFLHKNFPFCDVCSYFKVTDLESYFEIKGKHYDALIKGLGVNTFKNKKILEIGPGYGYLPKTLKENNIPHQYYCADIVHRFDNDNFIDINGYTLSTINDKFDLIIMYDVIQHLGSEIFLTYTTEIKKMLNDNGDLIISGNLHMDDFVGHFFGQTYHSLGYNNIQKHMTEKLNFSSDWKYLSVDDKNIGVILKYWKNI